MRPPDVDESVQAGESPTAYVDRLAVEKAHAVEADPDTLVIAADTTVDLGGEILAKPVDAADAAAMLRRLSGRTHRVHTGVAVRRGGEVRHEVVTSLVTFVPLSEADVEWYVATGEPLRVAGAFTLDGLAAPFIDGIDGDPSNVIGLSLPLLRTLVADLGHTWTDLWASG